VVNTKREWKSFFTHKVHFPEVTMVSWVLDIYRSFHLNRQLWNEGRIKTGITKLRFGLWSPDGQFLLPFIILKVFAISETLRVENSPVM